MKKNSIVISVVALCCILIVGMSPMAFGQEYIGQNGLISPMYTSISDISASLAISDDTASCSAYVSTKTSCHISLEVRLQQKINGTWRTIKTWTVSEIGRASCRERV